MRLLLRQLRPVRHYPYCMRVLFDSCAATGLATLCVPLCCCWLSQAARLLLSSCAAGCSLCTGNAMQGPVPGALHC
jgi:hypothetical protein